MYVYIYIYIYLSIPIYILHTCTCSFILERMLMVTEHPMEFFFWTGLIQERWGTWTLLLYIIVRSHIFSVSLKLNYQFPSMIGPASYPMTFAIAVPKTMFVAGSTSTTGFWHNFFPWRALWFLRKVAGWFSWWAKQTMKLSSWNRSFCFSAVKCCCFSIATWYDEPRSPGLERLFSAWRSGNMTVLMSSGQTLAAFGMAGLVLDGYFRTFWSFWIILIFLIHHHCDKWISMIGFVAARESSEMFFFGRVSKMGHGDKIIALRERERWHMSFALVFLVKKSKKAASTTIKCPSPPDGIILFVYTWMCIHTHIYIYTLHMCLFGGSFVPHWRIFAMQHGPTLHDCLQGCFPLPMRGPYDTYPRRSGKHTKRSKSDMDHGHWNSWFTH